MTTVDYDPDAERQAILDRMDRVIEALQALTRALRTEIEADDN